MEQTNVGDVMVRAMKWVGVWWAVGLTACTAVQLHGTSSAPAIAPATATTGDSSGGSSTVTVPDVMGLSQAAAEAKLHAGGVRDVRTDNPEQLSTNARVCSEVPGGGHENRVSLPVVLRYCDNTPVAQKGPPSLIGLQPDQAKQLAVGNGWTHNIVVREIVDDPNCKLGTVCRTYPEDWQYDNSADLVLYVAGNVAIKAPE
jgi:beta-lactam-binding protein with PASTA domain